MKITIIMKSDKPNIKLDHENININTLTAVINSYIVGTDNFIYYNTENDVSVKDVIQKALNNIDEDITHIIYLNSSVIIKNLLLNLENHIELLIDDENINNSKICIVKVNENTKRNISLLDKKNIQISPTLLNYCLESDSVEFFCKKIIELKINFNEIFNNITEKSITVSDIDFTDGITMTISDKPSVFIGTPCFGAQVSCNYTKSLITTIELLKSHNINVIVHFLPNQIVTRARNLLACEFLKSACTHLLFIDADIQWNPEDVLKLINHNKKLCVGLYANKGYVGNVRESNIFKNIQYSSTLFDNGHTMNENNLLEIKHGATGFMLIERDIFDKVREKTDSFIYQGTRMNDYFPCKVVDDNYLTEDYAFCQMWRETGGKIWADMSICLNHEGFHSYQGNPLSTFSTN